MAALLAPTTRSVRVVPGKVTKLVSVPFGAFVRVDDGIEAWLHLRARPRAHVELPEQVVNVGDDIFVKVIDIDLERRRISLSLKQANDAASAVAEFDPTMYGMAAEYDEPALQTPRASTPTRRSGSRATRCSAK